jgi:hypothetical protein
MKHYLITTLVLLTLTLTTPLRADDDFENALVTDRPDAAEASVTVGQLIFQTETSFSFAYNKDAGATTNTYSFPTLLRFGIIDPLELRIEGEIFSVQTQTGTARQSDVNDLDFGLKGHLFDQAGWRPSLGLLAHITTPIGRAPFTDSGYAPIFKVIADWDLPKDFSLGSNLGFDVPVRDSAGDKYARILYTFALGIPSPWISERLGFFLEHAGAIATQSGKDHELSINSGVTFLITPNMQIDTFVGIGLNDATDDIGTGLGFSFRI